MDTEKKTEMPKGFRKAKSPTEGAGRYFGNTIVIEFVGSVVISGIVGALADRAFGTAPWGTLGMVFLGFAAGMAAAWRTLNKPEGRE
jgi:F0F1-type ATP synthase assembly protein I